MDEFNSASSTREVIKDKLRQCFDGRIVRKNLTKSIKEGTNVPVYVLEFLLGQYSLTPEVFQNKLSLILKVCAMENFCAVLLESDNENNCY